MTVVVDFFTVSHEDTAERDGLKGNAQPGPGSPTPELASQLHLTQVHDLVSRINSQLRRLSGEQRHFRGRCARMSTAPLVLPRPRWACSAGLLSCEVPAGVVHGHRRHAHLRWYIELPEWQLVTAAAGTHLSVEAGHPAAHHDRSMVAVAFAQVAQEPPCRLQDGGMHAACTCAVS